MASDDAFQIALERLSAQMHAAAIWSAKAVLMTEDAQAPEFVSARVSRELVIRDAISQSCREWIATGTWLMMNKA